MLLEPAVQAGAAPAPAGRAQWADVAKGACILLVVLWHVIVKHYLLVDWRLGVPLPGAWGTLGEQLLPLRMPLFFTVSGLFAVAAVNRPWRVLARTRTARFGYLYAVWLAIHTVLLAVAPGFPTDRADSVSGLLEQLTVTPSNLWYLYALALYFAVAKAVRRLSRPLVLGAALLLSAVTAAGLLATPGNRGGVYQNLVFFLGGMYLRPHLERWAATVTSRRLAWTGGLYGGALAVMAAAGAQRWIGVWFVVSVAAVAFGLTAAAWSSRWPGVAAALAALGRRTLPVYVIHMPVLALLHVLLVGPVSRLGTAGQTVAALGYPVALTAVVVAVSLALHRRLVAPPTGWLFDLPGGRPRWRPSHRAPGGPA